MSFEWILLTLQTPCDNGECGLAESLLCDRSWRNLRAGIHKDCLGFWLLGPQWKLKYGIIIYFNIAHVISNCIYLPKPFSTTWGSANISWEVPPSLASSISASILGFVSSAGCVCGDINSAGGISEATGASMYWLSFTGIGVEGKECCDVMLWSSVEFIDTSMGLGLGGGCGL